MRFLRVLGTKGFSKPHGCLSDTPTYKQVPWKGTGGVQLATGGRGSGLERPGAGPWQFPAEEDAQPTAHSPPAAPGARHPRWGSLREEAGGYQAPTAGATAAARRYGPRGPPRHGGAASELFRAAGPGTATPWPGSGLPVAAMRARLHSNKAPFAPGDAAARITWRGRVLKGPAGENDAGGGGAAGPVPPGRPALPRGAPAVPNRLAWRGPRGGGRRRQQDGVRPSAVGPAGRGCPGLRGR